MSFIRPEVLNGIWRWREVLFGALLAAIGMYWAVAEQGLMAAIGTALSVAGALAIFTGFQRTRFRVGTGGPGIVQVHERLVTYYGPLDGGSVSIDALESVVLDPTAKPAAWVLKELGSPPLYIPTNAENAELLFDAFASLEGIRTENMLTKLRANPEMPVTIWQQPARQMH